MAGARSDPRRRRPCATTVAAGSRPTSSDRRARRRPPERVARRAVDLVQEGAQPAPLMLAQPRGLQRLERAVVHQARSLKRWILPVAVFGSSPTNSIQRGYL